MSGFKNIFLLFFLIGSYSLLAQDELKISEENLILKDSIKKNTINPLAPSKAAFYSAIVPGLGQAYNKKYWKIPIVWGAIGTSAYAYIWNNKKYNQYRTEYKNRLQGLKIDEELKIFDKERLISGQKFYQKNRDFAALITAGLYILNIIDANVDAHLIQFNVNNNLSLKPDIQQNELSYRQNLGITLTYNF